MSHNPPMKDWTGQVVWLIGASTGIGRATAALLHQRGAQVVVSARQAQALAAFESAYPGSLALVLDVTDAAAVQRVADHIVHRFGHIDLVVDCAGHYQPMRALTFDLAQAKRHLEVNYLGALHVLSAVLPVLLRQRFGHLSLVASVAGYRGLPQSLAYGPTKAAMINLAETLYLDLAPMGLGVSVVNPGFVETPLTAQNEFAMPGLITAPAAAQAMVQGWARGDFEIHFPKKFTLWMKLLSHVSHGMYVQAVRRMTGL